MRVLCLKRTAIAPTLVPGGPVVKRGGHPAQRPAARRAPPTACRRISSWLGLSSTTRTTPNGRPAAPAPSHTDSMSTAIAPPRVQLRAALAQRESRNAHERDPRAPSARARSVVRRAHPRDHRAWAPRGGPRRGRVHLLGDDHFAGHRLRVEAAAEADHQQRTAPHEQSSSRAASRERCGPMPVLRTSALRRGRGDQRGLDPHRRRDQELAHGWPPTATGPLASCGRGLHRVAIPQARPPRRQPQLAERDPRRGRAPLSTAPSSVAGQPVSVHAPASTSPGTLRRAPGRSAARAGRGAEGRGVLAGDLEALDRRRPRAAVAARPAPAGSARAARPRSSCISRSAPDSETARYWLPAGAPAAALRSNRYWTGVPTPAANGWSSTGSVVDDVQVHDRRAARASPACPRSAPSRGSSSPPARSCGSATIARLRLDAIRRRDAARPSTAIAVTCALQPLGAPAQTHLDAGVCERAAAQGRR